MNPLVLMVAMELALVNGFEREWVYALYFVMEELEPWNIHVEIQVIEAIIVFCLFEFFQNTTLPEICAPSFHYVNHFTA